MYKFAVVSTGAVLLLFSLGASAADECHYHAPVQADLDAAGLQQLVIEVGPDKLSLQGESGLARVQVTGTACASSQALLKGIKLAATRTGTTARVQALDGENHFSLGSLFGNTYAYMKLQVRVPASLAVKLQQGSGDAYVRNVAALDASVGSGDLRVQTVAGRLRLQVGSGDVEVHTTGSLDGASIGSGDVQVTGVGADARVESIGSGDVELHTVGGNVKVGSLGSGDLAIHQVRGTVTIGSMASGDVTATHVIGSVEVGSIGSGDLVAEDVTGDLTVRALGSGSVQHHDVRGHVDVPAGP